MRIIHVELENIKSYREQTRISFTKGLNAISGLNGSGKTTVLEAIGYAVFNYLPYSQQSFVREGAKTGTVRVRFLASDEREYEIVRRVGTSGAYHVRDVAEDAIAVDRKDEVARWIREKALDIDEETDLASLFKNAIGVPQGTMTANFLTTATARKAVFDPLLRVDEYRTAWENLRETINLLRARDGQIAEDIARLEGEIERIPPLATALDDLGRQKAEVRRQLDRAIAEIGRLNDQKKDLDSLQASVHELQSEVRGLEYEVQRLEDRLYTRTEELRRSHEASRIATASEPGYLAVVVARKRQVALQAQANERAALQKQLADAQSKRQGFFGRIEALDKRLAECVQAATDAASLLEVVRQQDELESRHRDLAAEIRDGARLDGQIARLGDTAAVLERECVKRETRMGEARGARVRSEGLAAVQAELQRVADDLGALRPLRQQLTALTTEGKALRERHGALSRDVRQRDELLNTIAQLAPTAATLDPLVFKQGELRDRRSVVQATIAFQTVARTQLRQAYCPLLELTCPVVDKDAGVLATLDALDATGEDEAVSLEAELNVVEAQIVSARTAATEAQRLQVQEAGLSRSAEELANVGEALERCRASYQELSRALEQEGPLSDRQQQLQKEARLLQDAMKLAAELPLLEQHDARDREALAAQHEELEELRKQREVLREKESLAAALEAALHELGDPRRRQHSLHALANEMPGVESEIEQQQRELLEADGRVKALDGALVAFDAVDEESNEQQRIIEAHTDEHDMYLRVKDDAARIEERQAAVTTTGEELKHACDRCEEAQSRYDTVAASYDPAVHERIRGECDLAAKELGAAETHVRTITLKFDDTQAELERLRRQEQKLRKRRGERDELQRTARAVAFIRATITAAGPAVTEQLLKNISLGANDIYAEIMDDHAVELRWDRDYEIIVQRGPEERKFVQLSGGEQMSAALSVRLALLKEMSEVQFAFFDEPTQNMDVDRRENLAGQIRGIRGFEQLIVISHDDTFEHHTENLIHLKKEHEETVVE